MGIKFISACIFYAIHYTVQQLIIRELHKNLFDYFEFTPNLFYVLIFNPKNTTHSQFCYLYLRSLATLIKTIKLLIENISNKTKH